MRFQSFYKNVLALGFTAIMGLNAAQAELIDKNGLYGSRFERMDIHTLTQSASENDPSAQFFLAKRLQKGQAVERDAQKALYWYTRAANQGVAPAKLNLGIMYLRGEGVRADRQQARQWLEGAAQLGDNRASFALAILDEKDAKFVDAYKWYELSTKDAMLDNNIKDKARGKMGQLALNLSASDIERARQNAHTWFQNQ